VQIRSLAIQLAAELSDNLAIKDPRMIPLLEAVERKFQNGLGGDEECLDPELVENFVHREFRRFLETAANAVGDDETSEAILKIAS